MTHQILVIKHNVEHLLATFLVTFLATFLVTFLATFPAILTICLGIIGITLIVALSIVVLAYFVLSRRRRM